MYGSRITIQDIADELGVSRNTVSKAINNTGILADSTREKVLKKAQEMGYKQFSYMTLTDVDRAVSADIPDKRDIALLTPAVLGNSHFASLMLDKFQRELSQMGYILSMHRILEDDIKSLRLPVSFMPERIAGIVCIELFDRAYAEMVCGLGIPVLFIDTPADGFDHPLEADKLYMDNQAGIFSFVKEMSLRGRKRIGFIGEYMHCHSFYERYMGYRNAMYTLGLDCPEEFIFVRNRDHSRHPAYPPTEDYQDYLAEKLRSLKKLPDVFICANDFVALDVLQVCKKLGYSVPKDFYLCGFDDSPESKVVTPSLTTIHIHSEIMGFSAVQLLISRIKEPSLNYRTMHTETSLIYRESTGD